MKKSILLFCYLLSSIIGIKAQTYIRPPFLKAGDKVAIVAPSYYLDKTVVKMACDTLSKFGFIPVLGQHIFESYPSYSDSLNAYAGNASQRAEDLSWALSDDSIKAIICARGGYGAIQTLQNLDLSLFSQNPKWLVGYSDISALHMASLKAGVMSIHGNMCVNLASGGLEEEGNASMLSLLSGKRIPSYQLEATPYNICGQAEGVLIGGNLITLISLLGSKFDCIDGQDYILFLEEIGESMHAIDRLINMLKLQGKTQGIKAIIFGDLTDCRTELGYNCIEEMIRESLEGLDIALAFGLKSGHGVLNLPLIEGAKTIVSIDKCGVHIRQVL